MPDFYYQPPKPDNNSKKIVWLIILGITVIVLLFAYNARIKFVTTLLPETHTFLIIKKHAYKTGLMTPGNQYSKRIKQDLPRYKLKSTNFN